MLEVSNLQLQVKRPTNSLLEAPDLQERVK